MELSLLNAYAEQRPAEVEDAIKKKRIRMGMVIMLVLFFLIYFCYLNTKLHSSKSSTAVEATTIEVPSFEKDAEENDDKVNSTKTVSSTLKSPGRTEENASLPSTTPVDGDVPDGFPIKSFCIAYKRCILKTTKAKKIGKNVPSPSVVPCDFSFFRCDAGDARAICRSRAYFFKLGPMGNPVSAEGLSLMELKRLISTCDYYSSSSGGNSA